MAELLHLLCHECSVSSKFTAAKLFTTHVTKPTDRLASCHLLPVTVDLREPRHSSLSRHHINMNIYVYQTKHVSYVTPIPSLFTLTKLNSLVQNFYLKTAFCSIRFMLAKTCWCQTWSV